MTRGLHRSLLVTLLSFSPTVLLAQPAPEEPVESRPPLAPSSADGEPTGEAPAPPAPAPPPEEAEALPAEAPTTPVMPTAAMPEEGADDAFAFDAAGGEILLADEGPKLELYGFADFSYVHTLGPKDNILRQFVSPYPSFYVGHLNLYLASTLGNNWRSLAEVRFTYTPLGEESRRAADGSFTVVNTTAADYGELQRTFSWGGIELQRVWIEYQPFDFVSFRAGQWFTPYGYWNDDHGSPTIIAVHKPFPISEAFFPERQTGLAAHGKFFIDSTALGYHLTLSNGRGPYDAIRDLDNNKAVGGRLYVDTTALGNLTLGVQAYRGRYTASTRRFRVDTSGPAPVAEIYRTTDVAYEELSLGADARLLWKGLHVQAELLMNEAAYDDAHRPATDGFDPRPAFAADYRRWGAYLLAGYRTPWLGIMPYVLVEHSTFTNSDLAPPVYAYSGGLNLRPTPSVVLKAELAIAMFEGMGSTGLGADDLPYFGAQVAWAF